MPLLAALSDLWKGNCSLRASPEQLNGSKHESFTARCPQETGPAGAVRRHILLPGPLKRIFNSFFFYISDGAVSELAVSLFPDRSSHVLSINKFTFWVFILGI